MKKAFTMVILLLTGMLFPAAAIAQFLTNDNSCPSPVLSRLNRHKVAPGETIESIAQQYGLLPETLIRLNPSLQQNSSVPVGTEILIPPFNGVRIEVPSGTTWQDLEQAYGVRADVLFELNGCTAQPKVVFLPGVAWQEEANAVYNYTGLSHYPLSQSGEVGQNYGWYTNPNTNQRGLHSGVDLIAELGTSVLAAEAGTVTFVGKHPIYGNLVILTHSQGQQTRYGHLQTMQVEEEQSVNAGETIGTLGQTGQPHIKLPHLHFEVRYQTAQGWVAQDPEIHLQSLNEVITEQE